MASVSRQAGAERGGKAIEIESLTKVYGKGATQVRAVDGISLSVVPGQIIGLLGPNENAAYCVSF